MNNNDVNLKKEKQMQKNNENKKKENLNQNNNDVEIIKISKIREIIAKKMAITKTEIPDATLTEEVDITDLVLLREKTKKELESKNIKLTYMAFIAKAVIIALNDFPIFNSSFVPEKNEIIRKKFINLGIAMDTPRGLIVPNIKNANELSIIEIAKQIKELAQDAKESKTTLTQIQNGTFTLSNFGSIGGLQCNPIINMPEIAILGIGRIVKKPIVKNDNIVIGNILHLSLTFDHRIIDGADAARFLNKISETLTNADELEKFI
ncbi:pyruvate dehydrogenase E2 component (dihydrolipoamide acetyltransferase) [Candidatus Phytoplasma luffae]|uniref:Pyruvate dehydrogenase E2 component (Dihydrolipoamide acetyltransferase) n=1 Tax=Loofah witches'-broom phytoplasma TaxID=35773 RepID=A0A975FII5_LOWBP|nr:dihydrolipoamide acetyltransferase family protein [Candidatus Phytoplasma luffae]QTX02651.1 pyruvate dehydrogenase E2 component (dihydrolipoamide acetyltransferase) [Candidatus Phytoplasma luffae]